MRYPVQLPVLICFTILAYGCADDKPAGPPPSPPVQIAVYTVQQENAAYYDEYPGTLTSLNEVEIRPQVSGYITGIYFKDGQRVTKGMKLYSIDQQQYRANVDQQIANLNVAKANLARVQQDAERYADLAKKDAIARQTLEHAQADLQASKMQVAAAQAAVRNVTSTLRFSTITSPLTGTIGISQVKLGAAVAPGQTILNTVSSDNPMAVDFAVDEKEIGRFINLQQAAKGKGDSTFTIVLPDQSVYPVPGKLSFIDRAVDPQTGTIKVRIVFPNDKKLLKPGMSCNIRVQNNSSTQKLMIPNKAVVEQMGEYFVYVISGDSATQRKVNIGTRIMEKVIVNSGLELNENVAIEGVQKLKEGAKVVVGAARSATPPTTAVPTTDTARKRL
ncbi:efflux RND transporter periplasmic adaptor subunit [Segetibacter sp. 3557_3]|uniref:efflux RND transporter periplasmic adaptor subunit n=1 Tax=Segetibacter sp. 3557_3 TaxID=2547429 RepID=UPI001058F739|nr:efflux RND transporter periplasmic adaptor subunit [Segetibacter sp. 3557_3]TDH29019.1 efflux RND transporter periplasmic adaptor subunit [Segetibacter sp. 3557_3]